MEKQFSQVHPMIIFWLGVLTGAVLIGLIFYYKTLTPVDYQGAFYKPGSYSLEKSTAPALKGSTTGIIDPTGGRTGIIDPTGGRTVAK